MKTIMLVIFGAIFLIFISFLIIVGFIYYGVHLKNRKNQEKSKICEKSGHNWHECKCNLCGKQNHEWKHIETDEKLSYSDMEGRYPSRIKVHIYKCTRCGKKMKKDIK